MNNLKIDIETLRETKGIGVKTLERIIEQHNLKSKIKAFESKYTPSDTYRINKDINLWQGDCLELMSHIPDKSIDMILCDLPYGTTACSWDSIVPFEPLWSHYKRIIKDEGVIALFGSEPFSTKLRMSNLDWYKYDWYWQKSKASNFANAKKMPMKDIETISIFARGVPLYNPQGLLPYGKTKHNGSKTIKHSSISALNGGAFKVSQYVQEFTNYPKQLLQFNSVGGDGLHPTQKPIPLLEYLIKTYTNANMLVLDNTMGSGSTGVACKNTNRRFIGIELGKEYFEISEERIEGVM